MYNFVCSLKEKNVCARTWHMAAFSEYLLNERLNEYGNLWILVASQGDLRGLRRVGGLS